MKDAIGRLSAGTALAALLALSATGVAVGQDSVEIRADGPDVVDSAAGADNVRVELNPGRQQAAAAQGEGNQEIRRAPRDDQERERDERNRDRGNNADGGGGDDAGGGSESSAVGAAPAEAAPVEAPQAQPEESSRATQQVADQPRPVRLPSTGAGLAGSMTPGVAALAAAGAALGGCVLRRRTE